MVKYPVVPGHEFVGEVVAIGPGDTPPLVVRRAPERLRPGDRVVADPAIPCGKCSACRAGHYNVCVNQQVLGVHLDGAMAELLAVRADCLLLVPDHVPDEHAAMVEPLSIGLNACQQAGVSASDWVVIFGAGMIGLACLLHARARRARCAVVEPLESRRQLAASLGAEVTISPDGIADSLLGWGVDGRPTVVVEASGTAEGLRQALAIAAPRARVVVLGFWPQPIELPATEITKKELTVVGSRLPGGTMAPALATVATGLIDPSPLPIATRSLADAPSAFSELAHGQLRVAKVLVRVE